MIVFPRPLLFQSCLTLPTLGIPTIPHERDLPPGKLARSARISPFDDMRRIHAAHAGGKRTFLIATSALTPLPRRIWVVCPDSRNESNNGVSTIVTQFPNIGLTIWILLGRVQERVPFECLRSFACFVCSLVRTKGFWNIEGIGDHFWSSFWFSNEQRYLSWGCRTRQPGRTWLIRPGAILVLIQNNT